MDILGEASLEEVAAGEDLQANFSSLIFLSDASISINRDVFFAYPEAVRWVFSTPVVFDRELLTFPLSHPKEPMAESKSPYCSL